MTGYGHRPPSRLVQVLVVGPAALAALVAIVIGAPALLLWLGADPLPDQVPSLDRIVEVLTSPDDGRLLMWALSIVGWLAWAVVAVSVLLELIAQLTGRSAPRVPGLGMPQRLAAVLVAAVLAALTAPGVSHAHAAYLDSPPVATAPADPTEAASDEDGWPILTATETADSPSTSTTTPLAQPSPAEPPAGATTQPLVHEVAPGDWMWHIAGRYLGDELRYPEIAALNPQYAERYANYPDHIQPGDRLILPADAYDRGERAHATGDPVGEASAAPPAADPAPAETAPAPAPEEQEPGTDGDAEPTAPEATEPEHTAPAPIESGTISPAPEQTDSEVGDATSGTGGGTPPVVTPPAQSAAPVPFPPPPGGVGPATTSPTAPTSTGPAPAGDYADPVEAAEAAETDPDSGPLFAAGVLAAVLLGAIGVYRWRKMARRRHRRTVTSATSAAAEVQLREAATADVARLDHALRVLSAGLAARLAEGANPAQLPDIGAVWIGQGEIHLILATPCELEPPPPFHAAGPGNWFLPADAPLPEVDGVLAPLPTLVTIGSRPGEHLLVDLERMGMLTVTGSAERTSGLLRYLVAELSHNPWSDGVEVTLAGFPPKVAAHLAALNPERISVAESLPAAVTTLRQRLAQRTEALRNHRLADSLHGRVSDTVADTWTPHLLLVDQPGADQDELLTYLEERDRKSVV